MFNYQAPEQLLSNKIILVTGANRGIGRAAALSFASYGATVILVGKNEEGLNQVYDDIVSQNLPEPVMVTLDLEKANYDQYLELQNHIGLTFGRLDGLVNNASIISRLAPINDTLVQDFSKVMKVNVEASFMLTKAMLPLLEEAPHASVVFTSSSVGRQGRAYWGAYAVSKFATEGLMQVLADELENTSNIRVNTINPGATATDMRAQAYPAEEKGKNPEPHAIMPLYLYLMGDNSLGVNGQALDAQSGEPQPPAN
ncbi:MAG: YciK family oxidoreductase [Cellvibrionales bacterium]|nr:YciK family oxidoreductase [Cellvibrionales bacterium]